MDSLLLKTEIQNVIDQIPENLLPGVLKYLTEIQKQPEESLLLSKFMNLTLIDDKELLEKLAQ